MQRKFPYITVGQILDELAQEGLPITRVTFYRKEKTFLDIEDIARPLIEEYDTTSDPDRREAIEAELNAKGITLEQARRVLANPFPRPVKTSGTLKWRVYSPDQKEKVKEILKREYNML